MDRKTRMTIPTQLVLEALLGAPGRELYGLEIGDLAELRRGTVHPILARLEGVGWLTSRWEEIDPQAEGRLLAALLPAHRRRGAGRPRRAGQGLPAGSWPPSPAGGAGVSGPRALVPGARLGIALAVRPLPTRRDRDRYYSEFVAELYGQPASEQLRTVSGLLSQTFALRAALGADVARGFDPALTRTTTTGQRLRCRHMRWHHWATFSAPDGGRYVACAVCHKDHGSWAASRDTFGGWGPPAG